MSITDSSAPPALDARASLAAAVGRLADGGETARNLIFDVSDLLAYFPHNRAPTGIQRVQMEIIANLLDDPRVRLCRFAIERSHWAEIPPNLFMDLCAASKAGGNAQAKEWLDQYDVVDRAGRDKEMRFTPGDILVNLGSSWWLPDYFMYIRALKQDHGVLYVPLIYDMIPAIKPQFCIPELVQEFISWLTGVLVHSDHFLAISEASKADLIDLAARIGIEVLPDMVGVIPLDADYRSATSDHGTLIGDLPSVERPFVLFVSTLEVRKNQLALLDEWRHLLNEYPADKVPRLVLVGKKGFQGHRIEDRLLHDEMLSRRVSVFSGINDAELAQLYRDCLFTIYPSHYEGWGLPVTESLTYGKVPLTSTSSSLPEAGGDFAVYFESGSIADMRTKLRQLIFDDGFRKRQEAKIAATFRARSWYEIGAQARAELDRWIATGTFHADILSRPVEAGYFYPIRRMSSQTTWRGIGSGEIFRAGTHWHQLEDWGCWTKPAGGMLRIPVPTDGNHGIRLAVRGLPSRDSIIRITDTAGNILYRGNVIRDKTRWIALDVPPRQAQLSITLVSDITGGAPDDHRKLGIGCLGFYVFDKQDPDHSLRFLELAALGSFDDADYYRRLQ